MQKSFTRTGKKPKNYVYPISAEHVEAAFGSIYWLLSTRKTKRKIPGIEEIPVWAFHFDFQARRIEEAPEAILKETEHWRNPDFDYIWFEVKSTSDEYGYNYAVMLYIGLHLAYVGRSRIRTMHLITSIEGKPNPYSGGRTRIF